MPRGAWTKKAVERAGVLEVLFAERLRKRCSGQNVAPFIQTWR